MVVAVPPVALRVPPASLRLRLSPLTRVLASGLGVKYGRAFTTDTKGLWVRQAQPT